MIFERSRQIDYGSPYFLYINFVKGLLVLLLPILRNLSLFPLSFSSRPLLCHRLQEHRHCHTTKSLSRRYCLPHCRVRCCLPEVTFSHCHRPLFSMIAILLVRRVSSVSPPASAPPSGFSYQYHQELVPKTTYHEGFSTRDEVAAIAFGLWKESGGGKSRF
ncbi:uncharacterized protein LOC127747635 [Arachis duranensis]|uniref:Uncharacterized protein LOC127747635 n=1 Tax=Arachis duranensis TaxID=130453 RepID=A0A9C6TJG9_ARADU|nr:uncharacterized protein LOC127747635 [Arachis duranensis]